MSTLAQITPSLRDSILTESELAKELPKCSVRKLRAWRNLRIGPRWLRVGREVVYMRSSVLEWMRENEIAVAREQRRPRKLVMEPEPPEPGHASGSAAEVRRRARPGDLREAR